MKERKHKWGKRNRERIAAGLPPVTGQKPLTPDFSAASPPAGCKPPQMPSTVMIQASVIEELTARVKALEDAVRMIPLTPGDFLRYQPVKEKQ
jgi:hypothetical protein